MGFLTSAITSLSLDARLMYHRLPLISCSIHQGVAGCNDEDNQGQLLQCQQCKLQTQTLRKSVTQLMRKLQARLAVAVHNDTIGYNKAT